MIRMEDRGGGGAREKKDELHQYVYHLLRTLC